MNYAGEGFSDPEEIPLPSDIDNPWLRGRVEKSSEDYWPGPSPRRKR